MAAVDVLIADCLLDGVPELLELLNAREISRRPGDGQGTTRLTIDMNYVPPGAVTVEAVLQRTDEGVRVHSLAWGYAA